MQTSKVSCSKSSTCLFSYTPVHCCCETSQNVPYLGRPTGSSCDLDLVLELYVQGRSPWSPSSHGDLLLPRHDPFPTATPPIVQRRPTGSTWVSPYLSTSSVLIHQDHDAPCVVAADHRCDVHPISKVPILLTLRFPLYDYSTTTNSSCRVSLPSNSERLNSSPYQEVVFSEPSPSRRRCHPA